MSDVNSMWYDNINETLKLVRHLLEENSTNDTHYNDIRIYNDDSSAFIVEWVQVPWSREYGGNFKYVDEDQYVMTEYFLPDNSSIMLMTDEEFNDYLKEWLEEHPGWEKSQYDGWHNVIEEEHFRKQFEKEKE